MTQRISLADIDLLSVGNSLQLWGVVFSDGTALTLLPLPGVEAMTADLPITALIMDAAEWERFLRQSDLQEVIGPGKAILRKSQRLIDANLQWQAFKRDGYSCRYCGKQGPLTVDHVDLWEEGGATVLDNLISACRKCNKLRGNTPYDEWINGPVYNRLAHGLESATERQNEAVIATLPRLRSLRVAQVRSR